MSGFNSQYRSELSDYLQTSVADALFQLTYVCAVYIGFIREGFLGNSPLMAQSAQIGSKDLAQIHAQAKLLVVY